MKKHFSHHFFLFIVLIILVRVDIFAFTPRYNDPGVQGTYYLHDNPYPSKGQNGTWYAFGRAYEILGYRPNIRNGNANSWWANNINTNAYPYGQTPKLGAIACWNSGTYGHVAIVEDIINNKIVVSESNFSPAVTFRIREIDPYSIAGFQGYIYLIDEIPDTQSLTSSPEVTDGEYIINCQLSPDMAIQVDKNNQDNGANVSIGNTKFSDHQIWKFQKNSDGTFRVISKFNNKALDVQDVSTQNQANIHTWDYVDGSNQKWYVIHTGGGWFQFIAKHSKKPMDVSGGSSNEGTNIWQYEHNGSPAQFFKLTKIDSQNGQSQPTPYTPPTQPVLANNVTQTKPSTPLETQIVKRYYKKSEYDEGMYEGEWKNGHPNGFGKFTYDDFADDMFYSCQDSSGQNRKALYYEGNFIDGRRNGIGIVIYEHGCKQVGRFFGNWAVGKKVFEGRFYNENGDYFEGYLQATSTISANWHAAKIDNIDFSNPHSKKTVNSNPNVNNGTKNNAYFNTSEIQNGYYIIKSQIYDNLAVQTDMTKNNGSNVSIGIYKGYDTQKWYLQRNSDGTFRVISKYNNKALDVQDMSTQSQANIQTWDYVDGDNQKWYIVNTGNGWYQFVAKHSGHLMDVVGGVAESGTNIWQYKHNGSSAQNFRLENASEIKRNYETWGRAANTIRPVEYAYLSAFCNEAINTDKTEDEKKEAFLRLLSGFPSNHPLRSIEKKDLRIATSDTNKFMDAIVISYAKTAIVIFAGTHDKNDITTDWGLWVDSSPLWSIGAVGNIANYHWTETQFEAANHLIDDLEKHYDTILVTGHSLGGHFAADVTLNHNSVDECMTFDAPGRGDTIAKVIFDKNQVLKIRNYIAKGSSVSCWGTQVGAVTELAVEPSSESPLLKNHSIDNIINKLGGMAEVENAYKNSYY